MSVKFCVRSIAATAANFNDIYSPSWGLAVTRTILGEYMSVKFCEPSIAARAANFTDIYSPSFGLAVTRTIGDAAAIHVDPIWVHKSDLVDDNTFMLGVGGRFRVWKVY